MPRIPRLLNSGESTVYHVMSRTALEGFPLGEEENETLLKIIKQFSALYFVDILGFCLMGNHFHLLIRVHPENQYADEEIMARLDRFYHGQKVLHEGELAKYREKLSSLSEYMKDIKQAFTRTYNKQKNRSGYFWGQRFKSIIVEDGATLINCLAYIDLNPIRANLTETPEAYRWNTLGYLLQTDNRDNFLSLEFGLPGEERLSQQQRLEKYRQFVYEIGSLETSKGKSIRPELLEKEAKKGFSITRADRFKHRTRYFIDSGVIGSRRFVMAHYRQFQEYFSSKREKKPVPIKGLEACFSLKRLAMEGC